MSIEETARAATQFFPDFAEATLITAICGAESGYEPTNRGDKAEGDLARYAANACDGYLSFGLGQVFLGVWLDTVREKMEQPQATPCDAAQWLMNPMNNMRMLRHIKDSQGWTAWSAYNAGTFQPLIMDAQQAVDRSLNGRPAARPSVARIGFTPGNMQIVLQDGQVFNYDLSHDRPIEVSVDAAPF